VEFARARFSGVPHELACRLPWTFEVGLAVRDMGVVAVAVVSRGAPARCGGAGGDDRCARESAAAATRSPGPALYQCWPCPSSPPPVSTPTDPDRAARAANLYRGPLAPCLGDQRSPRVLPYRNSSVVTQPMPTGLSARCVVVVRFGPTRRARTALFHTLRRSVLRGKSLPRSQAARLIVRPTAQQLEHPVARAGHRGTVSFEPVSRLPCGQRGRCSR